jgi:hypothetical protein
MKHDPLLARLANPLIDAASNMGDIVTHFHRSPDLDRLRRMQILYWKLEAMIAALAADAGARDKGTAHAMLVELGNQIAADERALCADIKQLEQAAKTEADPTRRDDPEAVATAWLVALALHGLEIPAADVRTAVARAVLHDEDEP